MPHKRSSKLLLVVLGLASWAGIASAQITAATPSDLTYTTAATNVASTTSAIGGTSGDSYTIGPIAYVTGANWITSASGTQSTLTDTVTILLNTAAAATMGAGTFTATIPVTDTTTPSTATITVTLVVTSPLSATTASTTMSAVVGQASTTYVDTVSSVDTAFDTYTVSATAGCPSYLTWANAPAGALQAQSGASSVLTFTLNPTGQSAATITTCVVTLKYNAVSIAAITFTSLTVVTQPLTISANPIPLGYSKGTSAVTGTGQSTASIKTATGVSVAFILDVATVPPWLTLVSGVSGSPLGANTGTGAGDPVVYTVNTSVAAGMATGNYTAQVGFFETGLADLFVPFTLQISNAAPSLTVTPSTAQVISFTSSMSVPQPTATLYSTGEPVPFTATCVATPTAAYPTKTTGFSAAGCLLNGTVASGATTAVNGTAFTWGFPMTVTLDPLLFASTVLIGNTVTVSVAFSGLPAGFTAPTAVSYVYTIQPGAIANPLTVGPTSVAAGFKTSGSSFVVLVKGNNFVGPGSLTASSSVVDTQVWLGTPPVLLTNANASTLGSYVVLDAGRMQVTIVGSVLPALVAGKGALVIGVANQTTATAPAAATATASLNVTNNAVIYGMTSTASYNQPAVGTSPSFAPYEFVSIFGDNFGFTGLTNTSANASYDSFGKIVSPLALGTTTGAGAKAVTLAVKFVDVATGHISFTAPVEFANQNQINAIVPAGVVGDQNVTVTSAGVTSDNFLVHVVPADPGIFTLTSDGTGGGAIVNQSGTVNGIGKPALVSTTVSIYLAGLGAPNSIGLDAATANATNYPATCVEISGTALAPGLLNVKNLKVTTPAYTGPAWTNIDGAIMNFDAHDIIAGNTGDLNYPPCMATAAIAVTFGTATNNIVVTGTAGVGGIGYAGFVAGSVAGLYQINVVLPASLTPAGGTLLSGATPVSVAITPAGGSTYTSQSGVTIVF